MTMVREIYRALDSFAPFSSQMDFDNAGMLVGAPDATVTNVLIALDITSEVVQEAKRIGAELIVSHHPVIFQPMKRLMVDSVPYQLAANGMSAICAHTNLDLANGGVNDCLADTLGVQPAEILWVDDLPEGIIGELKEEFSPQAFAEWVKTKLQARGVTYTEGARVIRRVAMCGGAGAEVLFAAIASGADAFVTGESKHHLLLAAQDAGITFVTAGHYATEQVVLRPLCKRLQTEFPAVHFAVSTTECDPVRAL